MVLTAVMLSAAGGAWAGEPSPGQRPVVAVVVPLEGELAGAGEQLVEAAQLAGDRSGVQIEAVGEGSDGAETVEALQQLAGDERVVGVVGPIRREHATAAAQAAGRLQLPLLVYSPQANIERHSRWVMRARHSPGEQAEQLQEYLQRRNDIDAVGILAPRSQFGDDISVALVDAISDGSREVRALARYGEDTTDFRPHLQVLTGQRSYVGSRFRAGGRAVDRDGTVDAGRAARVEFDALVIPDSHDRVARLLPFLPGAGIATPAAPEGESVQLMGLSGWRGDGLEQAADHARGAVFFDTFGGVADGGAARWFVDVFRQHTEREPTTPEAEIYDLVALLAEFADQDGVASETRAAVAERLASGESYDGVSGRWEFAPNGALRSRLQRYEVGPTGGWSRVSP